MSNIGLSPPDSVFYGMLAESSNRRTIEERELKAILKKLQAEGIKGQWDYGNIHRGIPGKLIVGSLHILGSLHIFSDDPDKYGNRRFKVLTERGVLVIEHLLEEKLFEFLRGIFHDE